MCLHPQGHYVPAVSSAIYRANELGTGPMTIPLAGLAIGNGMTNPTLQFPAYADFALENKLISQGVSRSGGWRVCTCMRVFVCICMCVFGCDDGAGHCDWAGVYYACVRALWLGNGAFGALCCSRLTSVACGPAAAQLHDSIQWWMPLCQWGAEFCDTHQWRFACIIALEVSNVPGRASQPPCPSQLLHFGSQCRANGQLHHIYVRGMPSTCTVLCTTPIPASPAQSQVCQMTSFERILGANPDINVYDITKKCDGEAALPSYTSVNCHTLYRLHASHA